MTYRTDKPFAYPPRKRHPLRVLMSTLGDAASLSLFVVAGLVLAIMLRLAVVTLDAAFVGCGAC